MAKKKIGNLEATTVEFEWNGKTYREDKSIVEAIKRREDYSEEAPVKVLKKKVKTDK
tara:strand:- start:240 stop:410 length:171 start_codon:yes stop_codon:yes gene_type:complete